ncbi:MAG: hypothetical protein ACE5F7_06885 [Nitrospiria bacterium]
MNSRSREAGGERVYRINTKRIIGAVFAAAILLGGKSFLFATHEADHRYVVSGQVRDDAGWPRKDVVVSLQHKGGEKKTARTDEAGRYEVLFHLHNENLGEEIIVSAGNDEKTIKIAFDPEDKFTNRGDSVDFGAPRSGGEVSGSSLAAGILLAVFVGSYVVFSKKRKRKRRTEQKHSSKRKKKRR